MNRILSVIASQSYTTKLNVSAQFKHQITYKKIGGRYEKRIHGKNMKKIANKLQQKVLCSNILEILTHKLINLEKRNDTQMNAKHQTNKQTNEKKMCKVIRIYV